jgi:hypothetical protein
VGDACEQFIIRGLGPIDIATPELSLKVAESMNERTRGLPSQEAPECHLRTWLSVKLSLAHHVLHLRIAGLAGDDKNVR